MSHSFPIRCALTALLVLIAINLVQTTIIDIHHTDELVLCDPENRLVCYQFL
jgi:hypothetical protein